MANIVISRIQHRRGRRENLPQPLLPAEVALTSDTSQAWIGQDPILAVPSVNVYSDQLESTAQSIIDNKIVESQFDETFTTGSFATLITYLTGSPTPAVILVEDDILWDNTHRGTILTVTVDTPGTGHNIGDAVTAVSPTGTGFAGTVATLTGAPGTGIATITVTPGFGGSNYRYNNTTLTVAGGSGTASLVVSDVHSTTVHTAANTGIDAANTIPNVVAAVLAGAPTVIVSAAYSGTFTNSQMLVNNHIEAANLASLINRINSTTPGQITGLTHTNLNIEITGGTSAGAVVLPYEAGYYFEGIVLAANALKSLHVTTQAVTFASGVASEAYANIVSTAEQIYDLQKNGVSFGSVTFAIGTNIGTVTIGASTSFAKGDRLEVFGPAAPDGTLDQISITLTGTITV